MIPEYTGSARDFAKALGEVGWGKWDDREGFDGISWPTSDNDDIGYTERRSVRMIYYSMSIPEKRIFLENLPYTS